MAYTERIMIQDFRHKELEEITGDAPPWYERIGEPVIFSSILAPGKRSFFDDLSFIIDRWLANPRHASFLLSDIDAYRRLGQDEAIRHLSCGLDARHRLRLFEQHFGCQFYKNAGKPSPYHGQEQEIVPH